MIPQMPATPLPNKVPLSIHDIARHIAALRGSCNYTTVYRAIARLKIAPYAHNGFFRFFTGEQAGQIAACLRTPNRKTDTKVCA